MRTNKFRQLYNDGSGGNRCYLHMNVHITMVQVRTVVKNGKKITKLITSFITTVLYELSLYGVVDSIFCTSVSHTKPEQKKKEIHL